jgi:hypothetical protein
MQPRHPDEVQPVPERNIEYEPVPGKIPQEHQEDLEPPEDDADATAQPSRGAASTPFADDDA